MTMMRCTLASLATACASGGADAKKNKKRPTAGTHCRRWCVTRTVDVEEMNLITAEDARRPTPKPGTSRVKAHLIMPTLAEAGLEMVREKRSS